MTLPWLDLHTGDDPHPRRFDRLETALEYLRRVERLPQEALDAIARDREVHPPVARRSYRLSVRQAQGTPT